jgi:ATP-dependent Clp protease ATP-binding subunit ClpB
VNFKNTIIIMTSNCSEEQLHRLMRPEFINRIDEIITFKPLSESEILHIVELQIQGVTRMLAESGISMELTTGALQFLARQGFDPQYGARPVKRAIQHYLLNDLSKQILAGTVSRDSHIVVDEKDGVLVFSNRGSNE